MSGGVPPALQFALRHPERTQALILLSLAPYAPLTAEEQDLPVPLWLYDVLFASDLPLWGLRRLSPNALAIAPMFDARPELVAQMADDEVAFLEAMIAAFLPVTQRRTGLANEGAAIDPAAADRPGGRRGCARNLIGDARVWIATGRNSIDNVLVGKPPHFTRGTYFSTSERSMIDTDERFSTSDRDIGRVTE